MGSRATSSGPEGVCSCKATPLGKPMLLRVINEGDLIITVRDGVVLNYDAARKVLGIELLDVSKRADNPREMALEMLAG